LISEEIGWKLHTLLDSLDISSLLSNALLALHFILYGFANGINLHYIFYMRLAGVPNAQVIPFDLDSLWICREIPQRRCIQGASHKLMISCTLSRLAALFCMSQKVRLDQSRLLLALLSRFLIKLLFQK